MLKAPEITIKITPRQAQILALRGSGYSNDQISRELKISYNTVKVHLRSCYNKLGAVDCPHAISLALQYGFLIIEKPSQKS